MATPAPSHTSLRGETTQYFFYCDGWFEGPAGSYTKDEDVLEDGEYREEATYPNSCFAAANWTYNDDPGPGGDNEMLCMTYNPITDHFAIREGEYVL